MSSYIPLKIHSHYSLLMGLSKPVDIVNRCKKLNITSCAITDMGSVSGCISFYKEMKSNGIKPILGCELFITDQDSLIKTKENQKLSRLVLLAKNLSGWLNLIHIISISNSKERYYLKPRIDLDALKNIIDKDNLICIAGSSQGSYIKERISTNNELNENWKEQAILHIDLLKDIFGEPNLFIEIQLLDNSEKNQKISLALRNLCEENNINKIAGIDSYYCDEQDSVDQRILLCSNLKCTMSDISNKIISDIDTGFNHFFTSDRYHIPDNEEMLQIYSDTELKNTLKIDSLCEVYSPLNKPILPKFPHPATFSSETEYLRQLCRDGWRDKINNKIDKEEQTKYSDRIKKELSILEDAGLSSYFLIVKDIIDYIKINKWLPGPGRGSAAGCLVSYLIGITSIDPIKYNLLFERFYNAGRNTKDRISMPDIDVDVPITQRDNIIQYIKNKYGVDKVSQMITFNTLKGRGALKEVLRVYGATSFEEMNNITKHIPDEAKIADELQDLKDEDGFASIIRWALENNSEKLKEWCFIDDNKQLSGPLAKRFEQAIRIEGTKYNQSKHAAGIAIAAKTLQNICPMIYDNKTDQNIAGLEMNDLDAIGVIKFDILGIALLDKLMSINKYKE